MTPEEFKTKMQEIRKELYDEENDEEACHCCMDNLMCELLVSLGYGAGVNVFKAAPKWYA
jgi:hypothetical protein